MKLFQKLKSGMFAWTVAIIWFAGILIGTFVMVSYASSPGAAGTFPAHWPNSSGLAFDRRKPTLVMFVHPQCPCSRASISELAVLMAQCGDRVNAQVVFLQPEGATAEWVESDSWKAAARIPGVTVRGDVGGREAKLFGSETSGDTALYDAGGRLRFHGGITIARGHSGDNAGRTTLKALLTEKPSDRNTTPTFGCSLFPGQ